MPPFEYIFILRTFEISSGEFSSESVYSMIITTTSRKTYASFVLVGEFAKNKYLSAITCHQQTFRLWNLKVKIE